MMAEIRTTHEIAVTYRAYDLPQRAVVSAVVVRPGPKEWHLTVYSRPENLDCGERELPRGVLTVPTNQGPQVLERLLPQAQRFVDMPDGTILMVPPDLQLPER